MTKWIPEAPRHSGLYAIESSDRSNCTTSVYDAIMFDTREDCAAWCDSFNANHPEIGGGGPAFVPVEHGFEVVP